MSTVPTVNNQETNQDDLIMQQQRKIEKEIQDTIPLVSEKFPVSVLNSEYNDDVYATKVKKLEDRYSYLRRTRPDGNCFFRAFAYNYLEYLAQHKKEEYDVFLDRAIKSKDKLVQLGFPQFTIEDFYETFLDVVKRVDPASGDTESILKELHTVFNDQGLSDYVVVYLRLITSGQLQERADFYQNFIDGCTSIEEFRHKEVEPMFKESDHIHIIALCTELGVSVGTEYMDRGESQNNFHVFPEEGVVPQVNLLYRPGHYDILYPKK